MIEDSLGRRAHVVSYDKNYIPTEEEIKEILSIGLSLVTSKQKGFPYQAHVLGPNRERSNKIWQFCENNKIDTDIIALNAGGLDDEVYKANEGLFHMRTAPWTLIFTPRIAPANPFNRRNFDATNSVWELDDYDFVNTRNRESGAIEMGMIAKTITGAALDRGYDTSYNVCFPKDLELWQEHFPYVEFVPTLIQTIGKAKKYKWEMLLDEDHELNTDPAFDTIFNLVDKDT
tara:strand:- start:396 stop:1088 length:693 start_codon:yes stop_codon:yes gene_type:complete